MTTNIESLAKASKELMLKEPFYGLLIMSLNKVWSKTKVPTAGVGLKGINYELAINPDFWETLPPIQKVGLIKHELLHIAFFHLTDYTNYSDKKLLNVAMDIEINQYIQRDWLPENGCFLESFPELNMEAKKGTRYYYDKLKKESDEQNETIEQIVDAMEKGEGNCTLPNGQTIGLPQHDFESIEDLPEATRKLIEQQTKHVINQVADQVIKSKGSIPGEMAEIIERINKVDPPKFDWKGYIRRFAGKSVKTYTKKSRRKYNKRIPDNPGLKIKRQKHVLAAVDTSGSVSTNELKEFLNEMWHLAKTGSEVTLIQCDTAISHIGKFDPKQDIKIHGRGGTEFQPVIDYYNEHNKKYSCLMYFTDGECQAPDNPRGQILWVISSAGSTGWLEGSYGELIKLED
jgi:predicted metal-dependent peptidase